MCPESAALHLLSAWQHTPEEGSCCVDQYRHLIHFPVLSQALSGCQHSAAGLDNGQYHVQEARHQAGSIKGRRAPLRMPSAGRAQS